MSASFARNRKLRHELYINRGSRDANLELLDHEEWLRSMQPYLVGCHLHDVVWPARDHRVPLAGSVAFERLMPMVAPEKPVVWELSPSRKKAHIKRALPLWRERFGE